MGQSTGGDTVLPPVIDMKPAGPQGGARRITLRDIVELRELQEIRISPEGAWAALIVRQAFLACDCYRTALFVASTQGHGIPQKLAEEGALSGVRWSPDGRYVTYLSQYNGSPQLWRLDPLTRRKQLLLVHDPGPAQGSHEARISPRPSHQAGVLQYEWSPDGPRVADPARAPVEDSVISRVNDEGIIYDENRMWTMDILQRTWITPPHELWIYDVEQHRSERVYTASTAGATEPLARDRELRMGSARPPPRAQRCDGAQ